MRLGELRDISRGEHVEGELDTLIKRRHDQRVAEDGRERPEEVAWAESVRKHAAEHELATLYELRSYHLAHAACSHPADRRGR